METKLMYDTIDLMDNIKKSIVRTENWLYYFWDNDEVKEFINYNPNPDYWLKHAFIKITALTGYNAIVDVTLLEPNGNSIRLTDLTLVMSMFNDKIKQNMKQSYKEAIEEDISRKKFELKRCTESIAKLESEIKELEFKLKKECENGE